MTRADPAIIRAARAKITPEGAWTKGVSARDNQGVSVAAKDPLAVCWCPVGAILVSGGVCGVDGEFDALRGHLDVYTVGGWNDDPSRTHAEVLAAMDGCAEALEEGRL